MSEHAQTTAMPSPIYCTSWTLNYSPALIALHLFAPHTFRSLLSLHPCLLNDFTYGTKYPFIRIDIVVILRGTEFHVFSLDSLCKNVLRIEKVDWNEKATLRKYMQNISICAGNCFESFIFPDTLTETSPIHMTRLYGVHTESLSLHLSAFYLCLASTQSHTHTHTNPTQEHWYHRTTQAHRPDSVQYLLEHSCCYKSWEENMAAFFFSPLAKHSSAHRDSKVEKYRKPWLLIEYKWDRGAQAGVRGRKRRVIDQETDKQVSNWTFRWEGRI